MSEYEPEKAFLHGTKCDSDAFLAITEYLPLKMNEM